MSVKKQEKVDLSPEKIKQKKKKTSSKKGSKEKQKINELKQKLVQGEDRHLRLVAEFDNFRRRKEKEITQMLQYEGKAIFEDLLSIIDDLDRLRREFN
jgi:molecular chaperone GrpE